MSPLSTTAVNLLQELQRRNGEPVAYYREVSWMRELEAAGLVTIESTGNARGARFLVRLKKAQKP